MNYRLLLVALTLLPMIFYYIKLSFAPKQMATFFVFGMPSSIFFGVLVMAWGVLMAIIYVWIRQMQMTKQSLRKDP